MVPYDSATKILADSALIILQILNPKIKFKDLEELPTDFQEILIRRVDLLFRALINNKKELLHVELQAYFDADLSVRILIYYCLIYLKYRQWPKQYVIHIKRKRGTFFERLKTDLLSFGYYNVYLGGLDANEFVENENLGVVVYSILMKIPKKNQKQHIEKIFKKIVSSPIPESTKWLYLDCAELLITNEEELLNTFNNVKKMFTYGPYLENLSTFKEGVSKGISLGKIEGKMDGKAEIAYYAYHNLKMDLAQLKSFMNMSEEEVLMLVRHHEEFLKNSKS